MEGRFAGIKHTRKKLRRGGGRVNESGILENLSTLEGDEAKANAANVLVRLFNLKSISASTLAFGLWILFSSY